MIDWALARRVAAAASPAPTPPTPRLPGDLAALRRRRRAARRRLHRAAAARRRCRRPRRSTGPSGSRANLAAMRATARPGRRRVGARRGPAAPAPLRARPARCSPPRSAALSASSSQRVLGQYELVAARARRARRGCCSSRPNLAEAARELDADARGARCTGSRCTRSRTRCSSSACRGCATHLGGAAARAAATRWRSARPRALRAAARRRDDLAGAGRRACARAASSRSSPGPSERATLDRMQATMAVSRATPSTSWTRSARRRCPTSPRCAPRWTRRRATASAPARLLERLLGLEMKLRQYERRQALLRRGRARGGIGRSTASGARRRRCRPRRARGPGWLAGAPRARCPPAA